MWKKGYPSYERFYFSGDAIIDIKEISEYPLSKKEDEIISNIIFMQGIEIMRILKIDQDFLRAMKTEMFEN